MNVEIRNELLRKKGEELIQKSLEMNVKLNLILTELENLSSHWNSKAGIAYITMVKDKIVMPLQNLKDILQTKGEYMINVAKTYSLFEEYYYNFKIID